MVEYTLKVGNDIRTLVLIKSDEFDIYSVEWDDVTLGFLTYEKKSRKWLGSSSFTVMLSNELGRFIKRHHKKMKLERILDNG